MLQRMIRRVILALVRLYYPRIEIEGREHLPTSGPLLFVLNHPNGLLDPLVLMAALNGRRISFLAKNTLFNNPLGRLMMRAFDALPIFRQRDAHGGDTRALNDTTFARCREHLRRRLPMALFPEGATHSEPMMLPLKTGAARIALGAEAENSWQLGLHLVPVGLWYERKRVFRSAVLLIIGQPFSIERHAEAYASDPEEAVAAVTERMSRHLGQVVFQTNNAELLRGLPLLVDWTIRHLRMRRQAAHARLAAAFARAEPQQLAALAAHAQRYRRTLRMLGISDPWATNLPLAQRARFFAMGALLVLGLPFALAGALISYAQYRLGGSIAGRLTSEQELLGTIKLVAGMVLVPLGWIGVALLVGRLAGPVAGWTLLGLAPLLAYVALRWGELAHEFYEAASTSWLRMFDRSLLDQLQARRNTLSAQIVSTVLELSDHELAV